MTAAVRAAADATGVRNVSGRVLAVSGTGIVRPAREAADTARREEDRSGPAAVRELDRLS
jgi:hypothetical protein